MSMSLTVSRIRRSEPAISRRSTPPCALRASAARGQVFLDAGADLLADAGQGPQPATRGHDGDVLGQGLQRLRGALPGADAEAGLVADFEQGGDLVEQAGDLEISHSMQFTTGFPARRPRREPSGRVSRALGRARDLRRLVYRMRRLARA